MKLIEKILIEGNQRYGLKNGSLNNFLLKAISKIFNLNYKEMYLSHPDRRKIVEAYWGGEDGYQHAKNQFFRTEEDWRSIYGNFSDEVNKNLLKGANILEIGCSAGQWVERLDLVNCDCKYLGIDINQDSIKFASNYFSKWPNIKFQHGDIIDIANFNLFTMVLSCQTMFFLDPQSIKLILNKFEHETMLILQEPVNPDYSNFKESQGILSNKKGTVGFSHNYIELLTDNHFQIIKKQDIDFDHDLYQRILIVATKE